MATVQLGSRVRQRTLVAQQQVLGRQTITYEGQSAGDTTYRSNIFGHPMYDFSVLEKCWDELHNREEVVKYYVKKRCHRRVYLSPDEATAYKALFASRGQHPPDLYAKVGHGKYFSSGGPLALVRCSRLDEYIVKGKGTYVNTKIKPWEAKYVGGFLPTSWSEISPSSVDLWYGHQARIADPQKLFQDLEPLGASAWNRSRPRTSLADLPTFLGELRDFPGMLRTSAKGFHDLWSTMGGKKYPSLADAPKKVSDHFLNHAFGWAPFVGDLMKFYEVHQNLDRHIQQMLRDNGQWVKRRRRVEETTKMDNIKTWQGAVPAITPTLHDWMYKPRNGKYGTTTWFREVYSTVWFVGSFKYYIPRPPDNPDTRNYNRVMDLLRLYGVNLSPSVIWNLTPWSWLADWFGNAGDIIDNVTAQNNDNLTARYAYIMRHNRERYVNDSTVYLVDGDVRMTWAREIDTKARLDAQPFGFGLTGGGIDSPYRTAIVAALGLSHSTRVAR